MVAGAIDDAVRREAWLELLFFSVSRGDLEPHL